MTGEELGSARHDWFSGAKYGMFIHWGMYAVYARGEQVLFREHLQPSVYRQRTADFRARLYRPEQWAELAVDGGMGYAVLTAKHHDGYCLFDSQVSDFTSVEVGPERDLVRDYLTAFRDVDRRVGLYYSLADWSRPAYWAGPEDDPEAFETFIDYTHAQVRELCSYYGPLDILWFDGAWPYGPDTWRSDELLAMIRDLQPGALVNDRTGLPGDFATREQQIPGGAQERPWEACITSVERHWGYHMGETLWKTPDQVIHMLAKVAEGGGNLLLNVGPRADGTLPQAFIDLTREVGDWLEKNGESIYHTSAGITETISIGRQTVSGSRVYVHALYWPGSTVHLAGIKGKLLSARLLADEWPVKFEQEGEHIYLRDMPSLPPDPRNTVIVLQFDGPPEPYPWAAERLWHGDAGRMADWAQT
jgi:alpha-L-fucosidase